MTEQYVREDRITQERQQRRRRDDITIDGSQRLNLAIDPVVEQRLKDAGRVPRWISDEGNRMHNLTVLDDYDRVDGVEPVVTGTTKEGKPIKSYLCSKPKAFIEEDRAKMEERRQETEKALVRGNIPNDPTAGDDSVYADPANSISRGGRTPP